MTEHQEDPNREQGEVQLTKDARVFQKTTPTSRGLYDSQRVISKEEIIRVSEKTEFFIFDDKRIEFVEWLDDPEAKGGNDQAFIKVSDLPYDW